MAFDIFTISYPPHPLNTYWDFTRTKQGDKKENTPFLPESMYELSIRGLAQLVDEKSNLLFKVAMLWTMGDSLLEVDSYS
jgi:hypothetical protein